MFTQPIADISFFESIAPRTQFSQEDSLKWLARIHNQAEENKKTLNEYSDTDSNEGISPQKMEKFFARYGVNANKIKYRFFEAPDLIEGTPDAEKVYHLAKSKTSSQASFVEGKDIAFRNQVFSNRANEIFQEIYPPHSAPPAHIVHVTCTGYVSPSAAQRLVSNNRWSGKTQVTHAYHMGCYGALSGLRIAEGMVAAFARKNLGSSSKKVDIVHTEMSGLHLNPSNHVPDQIVVQTLFADGHIKYSVMPSGEAKEGFSILNIAEEIVPNSMEDMTWSPAHWGMAMSLSREVPEKIASHLRPFLERLIIPTGFSLAEVLKTGLFAIHPGGPKIIEGVQEILELSDSQITESKHVLLTRGNMSSATLPHVWKAISENQYSSGRVVVSLAFGPGLTLFGSVFSII